MSRHPRDARAIGQGRELFSPLHRGCPGDRGRLHIATGKRRVVKPSNSFRVGDAPFLADKAPEPDALAGAFARCDLIAPPVVNAEHWQSWRTTDHASRPRFSHLAWRDGEGG
jgi:hypothetical protein